MERQEHRCFVYLQRPDTAQWVTVGRYEQLADGRGEFVYAPSYLDAGAAFSIDPINLPLRERGHVYQARRYAGLHDVLRDAAPDEWGKAILRRQYGLPLASHDFRYLVLAGNKDRWGALKVGGGVKPDRSGADSPKIEHLQQLIKELGLMASGAPAQYPALRRRLVNTVSLGGARPKATVVDGAAFWLAKPRIAGDIEDIPKIEHATLTWSRAAGLNVAKSRHIAEGSVGAVLVERFDRCIVGRRMVLSGASLLECEYPARSIGDSRRDWSYPLLADALKRIGSPVEDRIELYGRMLFNALVGNDDDHPRNHAVVYVHEQGRWRLSPAFDIVPNVVDEPFQLSMQLAAGVWDMTATSSIAEWQRFGFQSEKDADDYRRLFVGRVTQAFAVARDLYPPVFAERLHERLNKMASVLLGAVVAPLAETIPAYPRPRR